MYNQFFTIKPRISEKNGGSKVVHLIYGAGENGEREEKYNKKKGETKKKNEI